MRFQFFFYILLFFIFFISIFSLVTKKRKIMHANYLFSLNKFLIYLIYIFFKKNEFLVTIGVLINLCNFHIFEILLC